MTDIEVVVKEQVRQITQAARAKTSRGLNFMRNAALVVLSQDGTGRVYRNGHVASAPGQPPAPDTGNLRRNWRKFSTVTGLGGQGIRITLKLKSDMFYQTFLEKGTRKMAPRPHKQRIKDKARPQLLTLFSSI